MTLLPNPRTYGSFQFVSCYGICLDKQLQEIYELLAGRTVTPASELLIDLKSGEIARLTPAGM